LRGDRVILANKRYLLYPGKRTCEVREPKSAKGQKRTHALHQQKDRLAAVSPKTRLDALKPVNQGTQTGPCRNQG